MYRILIVDDEPMVCKGLSKTIEKAQHIQAIMQTAGDGVEALEKIKTMKPHFVFTDIRMPKLDGLELCRLISEQYPSIQLVVVSGYGEFEYAKKCITYGVTNYILKPITKTKVHEALNRLVENYHTMRKSAVFSPLSIEAWVSKLVDAIWLLHTDDLQSLLVEWEQELAAYQLSPIQLETLLADFLEMLMKQLQQRGMDQQKVVVSKQITEEDGQLIDSFNSIINNILAQLKNSRRGKAKDMIEEAKNYIEKNLSKEVSLEEVADMLGLNPSYFSQYFKMRTNETFVQYRIKRRMEKAKRLLEIPHYRITDISHDIGYADHPHFTKTFKKNIGVSPSEYRKMLGIE